MALVGRSPVKVTAAPSTAPQEAMAASLQAHIDELVQKNRTCEHTIQRLQQTLAEEKERGIEVVSRLKAASQQEREEWREGCDSLLASHRIVHLRTRIELDKERMNVLLEKEENRRERINILHRDYRLTLFQAKESELEAKIGSLEDALEELTEEHEQDGQEYMERIGSLENELQKAEKLRKESISRLKAREAEFSSLQSEVATLRKENTAMKASSESTSVNLERTSLQLEGAKTNIVELESANAELKRTNADLKRQLDRWQSLETKGGAEVEEMRKRRIELEVQVKELQSRVKELDKSDSDSTKALEKEKKKVEKLKRENDRMAEVTEEAQSIAKKAQDEYDEAAKQLRAAQRLIEKLQSEKLSKNHKKKGNRLTQAIDEPTDEAEPESVGPSEREVEKFLTQSSKSRVRPRPAFKGKASDKELESAEEEEPEVSNERNDDDEDQQPKGTGKGKVRAQGENSNAVKKRKNKPPVEPERDEESEGRDDEENSRRKRSGKKKADALSSDSEDDSKKRAKSNSNKRDKVDDSDDDSSRKPDTTKRRAKSKDSQVHDAGTRSSSQPKARKPSSSQGTRTNNVDNSGEMDVRPKKKVKKLFSSTQPETFQWDILPKGEGFGGLEIPTHLSPVKETDTVPTRSVFGKVGSAFGLR